jgi:hypothetical protein
MGAEPLDLGHDHSLQFAAFAPGADSGLPEVERYGAHVYHRTPEGRDCVGFIVFDGLPPEIATGGPTWTVESWEPLTVSPSLLCSCGDHGFIRNGRWVAA